MEERQKWLDAVESFRIDIHSVIKCPHCEKENLRIKDVAFNENQITNGGERFIECSKCGKFEIVLYRNPPENWYLNHNRNS